MSEDFPAGDWPAAGAAQFASTHWSVVLRAGDSRAPESAAALEQLSRAYWYPLYSYVRRRGYEPAEAQDLTQELFCRLLETKALATVHPTKGKFRSFLLAAMNHLLANEWHRAHRQKRGGNAPPFSLDALAAEERFRLEPADPATPEAAFERRWAETLLDHVVQRLQAEWDARPRAQRFEDLKLFLLERKGAVSFADAAARLGVTLPALKSAVQKLRVRYREIFLEEIRHTLSEPAELQAEIRHLLAALGN